MQLGPVMTGTNKTETNELAKLIVSGILCSEDKSSAIIGNRIVHEGDQIQGANIIKINKEGVEFEMNGKKWTQKVQR
jgi:type II secretory pathway component PulC